MAAAEKRVENEMEDNKSVAQLLSDDSENKNEESKKA